MDAALLVVLPLIGGYIFASRWTVTKYVVDREDGHRLYFRAAFYGVFLFTAALLLRLALSRIDGYESVERSFTQLYRGALKGPTDSYQLNALTTALYALVLGSVLWIPFLFLPQLFLRYLYRRAIRHDEMESLIEEAARRVIPVFVTMENNKVYVGLLNETLAPKQHRTFLAILPLMSGYRDEVGKVTFTTFYDRMYRRLSKLPTVMGKGDFRIGIPMDKVQSISMFDVVVYEEFQTHATESIARSTRPRNKKKGVRKLS